MRISPPSRKGVAALLGAVNRLLKLSAQGLTNTTKVLSLAQGYLEFVPRPDDIFIVTYPRSGTTWMQMILYQLTTDGNMDFPHISQPIPWFEHAAFSGRNLQALPSPRVFKTHLPYRWIPKGAGKYIYIVRNGKDVAVSFYHLYMTHLNYTGTFAEFFDRFMRGRVQYGSWFTHVAGWWAHHDDPNVLWLKYEDLTNDLDSCIRLISRFCGIAIAPERYPTILERCSFAFMKQHETQFDHITEVAWEKGQIHNSFLRSGRVGDWKTHLSSSQEARFDRELAQRFDLAQIDLNLPIVSGPGESRTSSEGTVP